MRTSYGVSFVSFNLMYSKLIPGVLWTMSCHKKTKTKTKQCHVMSDDVISKHHLTEPTQQGHSCGPQHSNIILWMRPANERRRYIVTSPLIGWAHTWDDHCDNTVQSTYDVRCIKNIYNRINLAHPPFFRPDRKCLLWVQSLICGTLVFFFLGHMWYLITVKSLI